MRSIRWGCCLCLQLLGAFAVAGVCAPGTSPSEPLGGPQQFRFRFDKVFSDPASNAQGMVYPLAYEWNLGKSYPVVCACNGNGKVPREIRYSTKTELSLGANRPVGGKTIQFYQVNRYLQAGTEIYLAGGTLNFLPTPFVNQSNKDTDSVECRDGYAINTLGSGARGRVHLLISRPFVGTVQVPEFKVLDMYGSMGTPNEVLYWPLVSLYMSLSVTVPQNCMLAAGQQTVIDFGEIPLSSLPPAGAAGKHAVNRVFHIQCTNISAGVSVHLSLEGRSHGQDPRFLETSHSDVAIALESGGRLVPPTTPGTTPTSSQLIPIALDFQSLQAQFQLLAWPVRMTGRPAPGPFQGNASLRFDFE